MISNKNLIENNLYKIVKRKSIKQFEEKKILPSVLEEEDDYYDHDDNEPQRKFVFKVIFL